MTKCVRVLQMIGSLNMGGSQSMIMNIYRNTDRDKIQFDFIVDTPQEDFYANEIKELGGRIYVMPKFKGTNLLELKRAWNHFFKAHTEYKIIHSHVRSYAVIYINIAKKYGLKTIIHSHSTSNGEGVQSLIKSVLQYPLRYSADYLAACSAEAGEWLYGKRACRKPNYMLIPNGICVDDFLPSDKIKKRYSDEFGTDGKFVVGHIGRFHEAKNHMFLLDVFKKVHDRNNNAILILVGDGDLRIQIENKINNLGLNNSVILTGSRNDVAGILQIMDVFAFPSLWEGLPVTLVEAQAAGLPCVISNNITHDVDLSDLICRLPIDNEDLWCDKLLKKREKKIVTESIISAGFDVRDTAQKLTDFYVKLSQGD